MGEGPSREADRRRGVGQQLIPFKGFTGPEDSRRFVKSRTQSPKAKRPVSCAEPGVSSFLGCSYRISVLRHDRNHLRPRVAARKAFHHEKEHEESDEAPADRNCGVRGCFREVREPVEDGRGGVAEHGRPDAREDRPHEAHFAQNRRHGGHARAVKEHEEEVGKGGRLRREERADRVDRARRDFLLFGGRRFVGEVSDRKTQGVGDGRAQTREVFARDGKRFPERIRKGEARFVRFFVGGFGCGHLAVERIERPHNRFLGEDPREDPDRGGPIFFFNAHGFEYRNDRATDRRQDRLVAVLVPEGAVGAEGIEERQAGDDHDDCLTRADRKARDALPGAKHHAFQGRDVVGGNFHHEVRGAPGEYRVLQKEPRQHGGRDPDHVEGENEVLPVRGEEGRGKENVDRKSRAAAHEGRHHDGDDAVGRPVHRARRHDGGDVATETDDQGHEGFAGQSQRAHQAVHDERGARHVARVLKDGKEKVKEEDDRNEGRNRLKAPAHAVCEEYAQPVRSAERGEEFADPFDHDAAHENVEEVDEGPAHVLREEEHHVHDEEENRQAQPAVEDHAVDFLREALRHFTDARDRTVGDLLHEGVASARNENVRVALRFLVQSPNARLDGFEVDPGEFVVKARRLFHELHREPLGARDLRFAEVSGRFGDRALDPFVEAGLHARHHGVLERGEDRVFERVDPVFARSDHAHHGATEFARKRVEVDREAVLLGDVEHVHDDEHRDLHLDQLRREVEIALEIRGVDDVDDELGLARQDVVAGDAFVFARSVRRGDRIDARQVDEVDRNGAVREAADFLVDGDARPVADFLVGAREGVE